MKSKEPVEKQTYTFDVCGDGKTVYCGAFEVEDFEDAVKEARKMCKPLKLPGWMLKCRENGQSFAAVQFVNPATKEKQFL